MQKSYFSIYCQYQFKRVQWPQENQINNSIVLYVQMILVLVTTWLSRLGLALWILSLYELWISASPCKMRPKDAYCTAGIYRTLYGVLSCFGKWWINVRFYEYFFYYFLQVGNYLGGGVILALMNVVHLGRSRHPDTLNFLQNLYNYQMPYPLYIVQENAT